MLRKTILLSTVPLLLAFGAVAEEPVDLDMVNKIRDEGFHRSQVMDTISYMTDVIGPRLTGSPGMKQANDWTLEKLQEWGLENGYLDPFEFGRGWSFSYAAVHMTAPHQSPILALPSAWTPGTKGKVRGEVMRIKINAQEDLEQYEGKLKGKILIIDQDARNPFGNRRPSGDRDRRYSEEDLEEITAFEIPESRASDWRRGMQRRADLRNAIAKMLQKEKALATLEKSSRAAGILRVSGGGSREVEDPKGVTGLVVAQEHYALIERLLEREEKVELEIEVRARFHEEDSNAYNTIAEIPGSDLKDQIVMAGGHLDSWHTGTGATDNGASCAVIMEAVRILKTLDVQPRRTIRVGLWAGEEQGLLGSRAYVAEHFGKRAGEGRFARGPVEPGPDYEDFSVYFNMDNGGGRFRGVWGQENAAATPILEAWLRPFHDVGATTVTLRNTSGTDHQSFDGIGLPGFQFIQDPMDYFSKTHHTNLDVLDYLEEEDLKQAATILASFLYHAAMREEPFPRKPQPQPPKDWDQGERQGRRGAESEESGEHDE